MGKEKKENTSRRRLTIVMANIQGGLTTLRTVVCTLYTSSFNPHDKPLRQYD